LHTIRELRKDLLTSYGIDLSHEKINRWWSLKLFEADVNDNKYKSFTDEQYKEIRNLALLIEFGTPVNDIVSRNKLAIEKRIKILRQVVPHLRMPKIVV
jgi:DNA-binding transcriptional MerR regulator